MPVRAVEQSNIETKSKRIEHERSGGEGGRETSQIQWRDVESDLGDKTDGGVEQKGQG